MFARVEAVISAEGKLVVRSAAAPARGTCTVMTQIAAHALGLPLEDVTFELGDCTCRWRRSKVAPCM